MWTDSEESCAPWGTDTDASSEHEQERQTMDRMASGTVVLEPLIRPDLIALLLQDEVLEYAIEDELVDSHRYGRTSKIYMHRPSCYLKW